jgi:hypothetical protein
LHHQSTPYRATRDRGTREEIGDRVVSSHRPGYFVIKCG